MDELVCFLVGNLLLSVPKGSSAVGVLLNSKALSMERTRDWITDTQLLRTCAEIHNTTTGLPPEIVHPWTPDERDVQRTPDWYIKGSAQNPGLDARYILRPGTIESLFIAYRLTGHPQYREWGWNIFESITEHCRVLSGGYSWIKNVNMTLDPHPASASKESADAEGERRRISRVGVELDDAMETFFMERALEIPLSPLLKQLRMIFDTVVFNTEAHPLLSTHPSGRGSHEKRRGNARSPVPRP